MNELPQTLIEAVRYFSDLEICNAYMKRIKWPDGKITCPACDACGDRVGEIATRKVLKCKDCKKQFSLVDGTLFANSRLPLSHWFVAIWCVANGDEISSRSLGVALNLRQPSAWRMLVDVRKASIRIAH